MIVGLDLRLASPELRRAVTLDAARECPRTAPILRSIRLQLRRGPSTPPALRALPLDLPAWYLELGDLPLSAAEGHRPEGVAPAQVAPIVAPPEDMLRAATGWGLWLRYSGGILRPARLPPPPGGGTPRAIRAA